MKLLVTRPAAQAVEWVARLQAHGIDAAALPLIAIEPASDRAAVAQAWTQLGQQALVMFVSANAVEHFFAERPAGADWPAGVRAATVGPGTSRALRERGVPASLIVEPPADAQQFDSEALWQQLAGDAWAGRQVLVARGNGGRDWLAERLRDAGAAVEHLSVYRRHPPVFDAAQQALFEAALGAPGDHLWLFSSAEALDHLEAAAGAHDWSGARGIATHPRIAERARRLGVGTVAESRPGLDAVVACIQSLQCPSPP